MLLSDLQAYQRLVELALKVHFVILKLPTIEKYELGSQLRRSSNSAPANVAEGFGNKHTNIYLEGISRAQGEIRETIHHLYMCHLKGYILEVDFLWYKGQYEECSKMLYGLERALMKR